MRSGAFFTVLCTVLMGGCVTTETVRFQPKAGQEAIVRDGRPALTSKGKNSVVTILPTAREQQPGEQPKFAVQINNTSRKPIDFKIANVRATQEIPGGTAHDLRVYSYEQLVQQERNAQVGRAIAVAMIGGVNAGTARGYYGRAIAAEQNAALASDVAVQGQINLAALEASVLKDHTVMPGEAHRGLIVLEAPPNGSGHARKAYAIEMMVGADHHQFEVVHESVATR